MFNSGSIIQGHTNLTEIKAAAELLWRVDTDPSQVVMGFGFYGRTFTLTDSSCTTPGCQFSGGGDAGSCTDQSGYLAYYEIADILQKDSAITPIHDEEAAVLYFTWNKDQWISYDNGTTFKQKLDWATHVGLGGSLIWASDQGKLS
jgi:Chitinase